MDVARIAEWLRANTRVDVDVVVTSYVAGGGADDATALLAWLHSGGHVTDAEYRAAHAAQAVSTFVDDDGPMGPAGATLVPELATESTPAARHTTGGGGGKGLISPHTATAIVPKGLVGTGAMARVHVANEPVLRRVVAYKVMKAEVARNATAVRRFRTEAQITAQLDHPNIVPVYTYATDPSGTPAYSMKLVAGQTLEELLTRSAAARRAGQVPPELGLGALLETFVKVCDAVHFAHSKGVIHRDLKPANIMLGAHREVYVMDWGLAKVIAEADQNPEDSIGTDAGGLSATRVGTVLGTPAYMAPEQADGAFVGPAADQYALGLVLYEVVCGAPARPGESLDTVLQAAHDGVMRPFSPAGPGQPLPRELVAIIGKATAKAPLHRYMTVGELADDVRRYLANEAVRAEPDSWVQGLQRGMSQRREGTFRLLVLLGALLALAVIGALAKSVHDDRVARERSDRLAARVSDAGRLAAALDEHFTTVELRVGAIVTAARNLLVHGAPSDVPYYRNRAFFDVATRPPDMGMSPRWGKELSTAWPNVHVALDQWAQAEDALARLAPIRREMRDALLAPPLGTPPGSSGAITPDLAWLQVGGPVTYVDVGLENGAVLELPGAGWEPGTYDPRARPWYQNGALAATATWGLPFPAFAGGALLLPCSMAITDDAGTLLGVVSVEISLDSVVGRGLAPGGDGVREVFLVDDQGQVIVRSRNLDVKARATTLGEVHPTPPFAHPEIVPALTESSGHLELPDALLTWQRLHSAPWSLVVEADPLP